MSLFEIEVNPIFKIINSIVYLDEKEFKKYYKSNCLNDRNDDDITPFLNNDYILNASSNDFVSKRGNIGQDFTEFDEIQKFIKSKFNFLDYNKEQNTQLYPEWLLFYIAIKKVNLPLSERDFDGYINLFRYIGEIRHKQYIIRNIGNFLCLTEYDKIEEYREKLHLDYLEFLRENQFEKEYLFKFLNFIYKFHHHLKESEKYKLMWNIEVYIVETIRLLIDSGMDLKEIYNDTYKGMRGTYSVLHEIHLHKPLYIEESKHYFNSYVKKINDIFNDNISADTLIERLTQDEKNQDTLFSYLELTNRFNGNKRNELVMGSMIKAIVLGIEEIIRYKFNCTEQDKLNLYDKCIKKLCKGSHNLKPYFDLITPIMNNEEFFKKLEELCKESDSLEKFLMVYYHSRNYLAHNNIDMDKFFWGEDGQRTIISNVIDSIIIILYKLSTISVEQDEDIQ